MSVREHDPSIDDIFDTIFDSIGFSCASLSTHAMNGDRGVVYIRNMDDVVLTQDDKVKGSVSYVVQVALAVR